ncbi:transporter [Crossiella sp. CA-258035]|uniref:PH-like domain-containing protein n=1 Tax=Crossiella sp. CA-258035 TaxID=2981138 RepID=UPI0024BD28AE|nr:transporter [Crossiella sp. CA-258035]WHT17065.1 transporter [Crossiella sp. CA-258035]
MRLLLTLAVLALILLCAYGMLHGWRKRSRRQAAELPPFPAPPAGLSTVDPVLSPETGVYVGTTAAENWVDRITAGDLGHRAEATATLYPQGLLLDRTGASPLWIDTDAVRAARTARGLAGKVVGRNGLLVVTWQHGDHLLDTGFRGDDKTGYADWVTALTPQGKAAR